MNYIILDMEWNQPLYAKMTVTEPLVLHAEIVQIGAVKLNKDFEAVDSFNSFVAPKYYKKMHKKVEQLTGITTKELENSLPFPEVFEKFSTWCGDEFVFLTWGPDDIPVLRDNLSLHDIDKSWIPENYNLQVIFDSQITNEHRQFALSKALDIVHEVGEDAHNALGDAKSTALVCRHLNMADGVSCYDDLRVQFFAPHASENDELSNSYNSKREALNDKELTEFVCPVCNSRAVCFGFVRQNHGKTIAIAQCEKGDEFFVRFKFARNAEGKIKAKRAVFEMNEEYKKFYIEKKEALKPFGRARKKYS